MCGAPGLLSSVVAALLLPVLAAAAEPRAAALRISATPASLRLAEGDRATLRIAAPGEVPVVAASVGRIDALREVFSGVFEADYVPPDSIDPQVAFVTALSSRGFGWIAIPLAGARDVPVSARHGTPVSLTVGDESFGPVPADATGRAIVRVAVPPGVGTATFGRQSIDLGVREGSLVHVVLDRAEVEANASAVVTVRALVVDEYGSVRARAPVGLSASDGVLGPAVEVEPGLFQAQWKVGPGSVGEGRVTAAIARKPSSTAVASLARVAGPPRKITIRVDRDRMVAGDGDELAIAARIEDAAGNPTEAPANLLVSTGSVIAWDRTATGRYSGRVQVPRRRYGEQRLEVKVVAPGPLSATRQVALLPGPVSQVRVDADGELYADGRRRELRIALLDADENRVDAAQLPSLTAARGELGELRRHAPGAYRVDYRAPLAADGYREVVKVRAGPVETSAPLSVRALGGGVVLAPKVGFALGTGGLASFVGGAELGFWTRRIGLVLEGRFFTFSRTDAVQDVQLRSEATFLSLDASLAWRRPIGGGMLWLGAGGGAVHAGSRLSTPGQADLSSRTWVTSANGSVGWGWPFGPGIPFAEAKLAWHADPDRGPMRGSLQSVTMSVGYRFDVL